MGPVTNAKSEPMQIVSAGVGNSIAVQVGSAEPPVRRADGRGLYIPSSP
jgi:hypothetical protein